MFFQSELCLLDQENALCVKFVSFVAFFDFAGGCNIYRERDKTVIEPTPIQMNANPQIVNISFIDFNLRLSYKY